MSSVSDNSLIDVTPGAGNASRAAAISQSLKSVASKVRGVGPATWRPAATPTQRRWERTFIPGILIGFVVIVIVPAIVTAFYLAFIVSDQFASETRFAVRGGERTIVDPDSLLTGIASAPRVQDSMIVADYVYGRGIVEHLDRSLNLRALYSSEWIDYLSRFDPKEPIEELVDYWQKRVEVSIDPLSGIVTVIVRAFTANDAVNISKAVIADSERLVNELSERARNDTLRQAQAELNRAQSNLREKITAMRDLRNVEGLLDAKKESDALSNLMANLRLELIHLEQQYAVQQQQKVNSDAPHLRVLDARIRSMREQIKKIDAQMTSSNDPALADSMSRFDMRQMERTLAEQQYVAAASAFERARTEVESQQVYLMTFLQPVLAEDALYPKRHWIFSIVAVGCLLLWGALVGIAILVRDNLAI